MMRRQLLVHVLFMVFACLLGMSLFEDHANAQQKGTKTTAPGAQPAAKAGLPAQGGTTAGAPAPLVVAQNTVALAQLGKQIFFDKSLSNPPGQACGSCHMPGTGFTFPDSNVNLKLGVAPGAVPGRFGNRKVPTISYSNFSPPGPNLNPAINLFVGGQFWDGRALDEAAQVAGPLFNPNEMNNLINNQPAPQLVVAAIAKGAYAQQFQQVFGANVFNLPPAQVIPLIGQAVAAWEATADVSPFNAKYDLWRAGRAQFTAQELNGLRLVTGSVTGRPGGPPHKNAQCAQCHRIPGNPAAGPDLWTSFAYFNVGVPRNANNPFYTQTNAQINPLGFNPLGNAFVDLGLGFVAYPAQKLPAGNMGAGSNGQGDFLAVNGAFKTPTLRNVDKRPALGFVKAYFHNGGFKSLEQVVRFYNTRNLTTKAGEVIDFTQANPYAGLTGQPLWPAPEVPSPKTLRNPTGAAGQIGNLGLTLQEEADIVAFLRTLSDVPR